MWPFSAGRSGPSSLPFLTCSPTSLLPSLPSCVFTAVNNVLFLSFFISLSHSFSRTSLPLPTPLFASVPSSLFNKLRLHLPQCCSRLFGRPDGPVAQRWWLNAARRAHWLHCAFDEALHLSHSRACVCVCVCAQLCVCVADCEGMLVCPRRRL